LLNALKGCAVAWLLTSLPVAAGRAAEPCPSDLAAEIPGRATAAVGGSEFIDSIDGLARDEREAAVVAEVLSGNVPSFLHALVPVVLTVPSQLPGGAPLSATLCVMPDYLAVGSDDDFVRMPMNLKSSTEIARRLGFVLPTKGIVDAIHAQAAYLFEPRPLPPGPQMVTPPYFLLHETRIRAQTFADGAPLGELVAGHKKDVVLTNAFVSRPDRLTIYGWHRRDGKPIQPLSTAHDAAYADYSHGIRLVSQVVTIDGRQSSIFDLLENRRYAALFGLEGPIPGLRAAMLDPAPFARD
jgi:hypothetical protein